MGSTSPNEKFLKQVNHILDQIKKRIKFCKVSKNKCLELCNNFLRKKNYEGTLIK